MAKKSANSTRWLETALVCILPFLGWWFYGLFDLDEGYYAAVAGEMVRRHEWITPFYNGKPWFEKPILIYWFAKPSIMAFGQMVGPRLPSVLLTLLTIALVSIFAGRRFSGRAGQLAAFVMAGSLLPVYTGRMMLVDPLLTFFLFGSVLAYWESFEKGLLWRLICGAGIGLAVLAKGPVGLILFVMFAVALGVTKTVPWRALTHGWWLGALGCFGTIATWYVPVYLQNPGTFVQKFLIEQNLMRFTGGDAAHSIGWIGFFLFPLVLAVTGFPWSIYLWGAFRAPKSELHRFLWCWFWVVLVLFSLGGAKLPHYILPLFPAFALLVADHLANRLPEDQRIWAKLPDVLGPVSAVLVVAVVAQAGFSVYYNQEHRELYKIVEKIKGDPLPNLALYQMPRREKELGTLKPKVQETSHPSLFFYLDRTGAEVETFEELLAQPKPCWVITRNDRIPDTQIDEAARRGIVLSEEPFPEERLFKLYYMRAGE